MSGVLISTSNMKIFQNEKKERWEKQKQTFKENKTTKIGHLLEQLKELPSVPGCYLFRDRDRRIIYIGKSKCLNKRVRQYFQSLDQKSTKIQSMIMEIAEFDYIETPTETDALLLECQLIKEVQPLYNTQLKGNRQYPFIHIPMGVEQPGIFVSNEPKIDGAMTFGCFYSYDDAMAMVEVIGSVWKTPLCGRESFGKSETRACLQAHIGKCCAPCEQGGEEYRAAIMEVVQFLAGKNRSIVGRLKKEMAILAENMEFEKAARVRDRLAGLQVLLRRTKKFNTNLKDKEFCIFLRAFHEQRFSIFYVRDGVVLYRMPFDRIDELDTDKLHVFTEAVCNKEQNIEDGENLALCITEIFADKYYVELTKSKRNLSKVLMAHYDEFIPTNARR